MKAGIRALFVGDRLLQDRVAHALSQDVLVVAQSASVARAMFIEQRFDIILVGETLIDGRGESLLGWFADASCPAPVIFVTRGANPRSTRLAIEAGAVLCLEAAAVDRARILQALGQQPSKPLAGGQPSYLTRLSGFQQVAGGLAHELNNPSVSLRANTTVLDDYFSTITRFVRELRRVAAGGDLDAAALDALIDTHAMDEVIEDGGSIVEENLAGIKRIQATVELLSHAGRSGQRRAPMAIAG